MNPTEAGRWEVISFWDSTPTSPYVNIKVTLLDIVKEIYLSLMKPSENYK